VRLRGLLPAFFLAEVASVASVASVARVARAEETLNPWDAARDPAAAARFALHRRVREILSTPLMTAVLVPRDYALQRARVLLEQAHAEKSPDVLLRLDLGRVYADLDESVRAAETLQSAFDDDPDNPAVIAEFPTLANAYAKLDDSKDELRIYERFLPRVVGELTHTTGLLNMAEAEMHLGDLESAIDGYKATIDEAATLPNVYELEFHTGALARWGLAVAEDRSGDIDGAARTTRTIVEELDRDMQTIRFDRGVFFAPERERNWYVALGFAAYAQKAEDPRTAAGLYYRAEECWNEYVIDAKAHGSQDRWLDLALARYVRAHAQRVAAERRVKGRVVYPQTDCSR
jgi:tetratricopeptide (TPR) repeat protein